MMRQTLKPAEITLKPTGIIDVLSFVALALVIAAGAFLGGAVAFGHGQDKQELELLREHNGRLLAARDEVESNINELQFRVESVAVNAEGVHEAIEATQDYLWMARSALDELDKAVRRKATQTELKIIVRDIQEVVLQAERHLEEAIAYEIAESITRIRDGD